MQNTESSPALVASRRQAVRQAFSVACVVGPILIFLNNVDYFLVGSMPKHFLAKALLTVSVPFFVSLYSTLRVLGAPSGKCASESQEQVGL